MNSVYLGNVQLFPHAKAFNNVTTYLESAVVKDKSTMDALTQEQERKHMRKQKGKKGTEVKKSERKKNKTKNEERKLGKIKSFCFHVNFVLKICIHVTS